MDEKHFDESFKNILENSPSFEADEQAIAYMRHRLDEAERRKRRGGGWPWWIAAAMALPFLLSSIFFYQKLQQSQKQENGQTLHLTTQIDTIIHKHVVYHFDTIYTKVYQEVIMEPTFRSTELGQTSNFSLAFPSFYTSGSQNHTGIQGLDHGAYAFHNPLLDWNLEKSLKTEDGVAEAEELDWSKLTSIGTLPLGLIRVPRKYYWNTGVANDWPKPDAVQIEPKINPIYYFMPTGFKMGIHSSPLNFINLPNKSTNGLGYGIAAELQFGKHVSMRLGGELLKINFELKNEADFSAFPPIDPENPNDELKELYGNLNYLQIPLSFQYYFRPEKTLRPYLEAGIIASRPTKQSFRYEFIGAGGEYYLNQSIDNTTFSINNLRAAMGFEFLLWKNIYANVEGFYHYNFEQFKGPILQLRYWGVDLGVKYEF